jgi:potassium voltage-gated channel Eag-related subfamily H protein 8
MWDFVSFFLIFLISLYIPFIFAFNISPNDSNLKYFELYIDIWFLTELLLNFVTGYYDKGFLVQSRKSIALNYLKTWFVPDLISSFPYSFLYFTDALSASNVIVA